MRITLITGGNKGLDLNHHSGPQAVTEGTDAIVKMALVAKHGPTGTFSDRHGSLGW